MFVQKSNSSVWVNSFPHCFELYAVPQSRERERDLFIVDCNLGHGLVIDMGKCQHGIAMFDLFNCSTFSMMQNADA